MPVLLLIVRGEAQLLGLQDPSAFTSFRTDLQEVHSPLAFDSLQRLETQTTPWRVDPSEQFWGITHQPKMRLNLVLGQVVQSPERALKVLHFLAGSTLWQLPL